MFIIRITVSSTLNSSEVLPSRKYRSVKPNTQQSKKIEKLSKKKEVDEIIPETDEKDIIPDLDEPIEDTSEIGEFFPLCFTLRFFRNLFYLNTRKIAFSLPSIYTYIF